jgi:hypothetical protein
MVLMSQLTDPSMNDGHGERRTLERQTFNQLMQRGRQPTPLASVGTLLATETG